MVEFFLSDAYVEANFVTALIYFLVALHLFELYVDFRQYWLVRRTVSVPTFFKNDMTPEKFETSRYYFFDNYYFSLIKSTYELVFTIAYLHYRWVTQLYVFSAYLADTFFSFDAIAFDARANYIAVTIFVLLSSLISYVNSLPFKLIKTFVIEEKYNFNKQTIKFFIVDQIKKVLLMNLITCIVANIIVLVIFHTKNYFAFSATAALILFQMFFIFIYQDYIAPIFDKFTSLPEGSLQLSIKKLAKSLSMPLKDILVIDSSKRTGHSNAYFIGLFGKKTIVLYDSLLKKKEEDNDLNEYEENEILAVLCHEIGHWKKRHILKNLIFNSLNIFLIFYGFSFLIDYIPLYRSFYVNVTSSEQIPIIIGFVIITSYVFSPYNTLVSWVGSILSRKYEFEADHFAVRQKKGADLITALKKLQVQNLSFPLYDWLYSSINNSHPPLLERINAIRAKG